MNIIYYNLNSYKVSLLEITPPENMRALTPHSNVLTMYAFTLWPIKRVSLFAIPVLYEPAYYPSK